MHAFCLYNKSFKHQYRHGVKMRQWRLIYDKPTVGPVNMAVDEAILWAVSEGLAPPTLRLYAWEPPCLSLGYAQRFADVDWEGLKAKGWDVVRRPTGGRAILHTDELTYSISVPLEHPLAVGNVVESYRRISRALVIALEHLGLSPRADQRAEKRGKANNGPVCFETPSHYEITAGGRKLVGSAQVRRKAGILQHGTLPLYGDVARICDALTYSDSGAYERAREDVRARATTLESSLGMRMTWQQVAGAVERGFTEAFDIDFEEATLTAREQERVEQCRRDIYANDEWTLKR